MNTHQELSPATFAALGARLYVETCGSGPLLVLIPGGPTDAGIFSEVATALAGRYRVIACDPRGNSRSVADDIASDLDLDVLGDDVHRVIAATGGGRAHVFGTSGGAQIALNFAARYPEAVATLVAHEPPCLQLLDTPEPAIADAYAVRETYFRDGVEAAIQQFMAIAAMEDAPAAADAMPQDAPPEDETSLRIFGNFDYFFAHGVVPLSMYVPDVPALQALGHRVVIGVGTSTINDVAHLAGRALAHKLGRTPVVFPGDHTGFTSDPSTFADVLHRAISDAAVGGAA
jgi:pimeloyl-ACP methyl ester carboxylesterase